MSKRWYFELFSREHDNQKGYVNAPNALLDFKRFVSENGLTGKSLDEAVAVFNQFLSEQGVNSQVKFDWYEYVQRGSEMVEANGRRVAREYHRPVKVWMFWAKRYDSSVMDFEPATEYLGGVA